MSLLLLLLRAEHGDAKGALALAFLRGVSGLATIDPSAAAGALHALPCAPGDSWAGRSLKVTSYSRRPSPPTAAAAY
jgi:hypothetical protein